MKTHTRKCEECGRFFYATADDALGHAFACPKCREVPKVVDPLDYETVKCTGMTGGAPAYSLRLNSAKRGWR